MRIWSNAFRDGETIPREYSHDSDNVMPDIFWDDAPQDAAELAIVCEDTDAPSGRFAHLVAWGMDPIAHGVGGTSRDTRIILGRNDFGEIGWGGPDPDPGEESHQYIFRLFALDKPLDLPDDAGRDELLAAIDGHVLDTAELVGMQSSAAG